MESEVKIVEIKSKKELALTMQEISGLSKKSSKKLALKTWTKQKWEYTNFLSVVIQDTVVGFAHYNIPVDNNGNKSDFLYILSIIIRPEFRRSGLGKAIIKEIEWIATQENLKRVELESEESSFQFWIKMGYLPLVMTGSRTRMSYTLGEHKIEYNEKFTTNAFIDAVHKKGFVKDGILDIDLIVKDIQNFSDGQISIEDSIEFAKNIEKLIC